MNDIQYGTNEVISIKINLATLFWLKEKKTYLTQHSLVELFSRCGYQCYMGSMGLCMGFQPRFNSLPFLGCLARPATHRLRSSTPHWLYKHPNPSGQRPHTTRQPPRRRLLRFSLRLVSVASEQHVGTLAFWLVRFRRVCGFCLLV